MIRQPGIRSRFPYISSTLTWLIGFCIVVGSSLSCSPQGRDVPITLFRYWDSTMATSDREVWVQTGYTIEAPGGMGGPFWLECTVPADQIPQGAEMLVKNTDFAWELWQGHLLLGRSGSVFDPHNLEFLIPSIIPISPALVPQQGSISLQIRILPDSYPFVIPPLFLANQTRASDYHNRIIPLNREVYRSVATLCAFLTIYFFIYFFSRRKEQSGLFAALFNLFAFVYFVGMSQAWTSLKLPMIPVFAIFKAALIPTLLFMGLYFQSSYRKISTRYVLILSGIALALMIATVAIPYNYRSILQVFGVTIIPALVWIVAIFFNLLIRYWKKIPGLSIILLGCSVSIICGSHDLFFMYTGQTPLFLLQGLGIFTLQASLFMAMALKSAVNQNSIESYAVDVEEQVSIKTAELVKLNQELRSASLAKTAFLAHMSHEIRTPLNSIMGFTQLLQDSETDPSKNRQLHLIYQESRILLDLINEVLDVSRIEGGKLRLEESSFSPLDVFSYCVETMSSLAHKHAITLEFKPLSPLPELVIGDALRLQQILHNLLGNAIKFTLEGSVSLEVSTLVKGRTAHMEIQIKDTGIGIPADKLDKIFHSFEQADSSITRRFGGSGLGLTIVQELVRLMHGSIRIESVPGQGTSVWTTIPFVLSSSGSKDGQSFHEEAQPGSLRPAQAGRFKEGTQILAVEDYEPNVQLLRMFLEPMGARVAHAALGSEAFSWLQEHRPQLIFMDLHMPDMDGYETAMHIRREFPELRQVPIIALTADAWNDVQGRCLRSGMQEVLTKPLILDHLVKLLHRLAPELFEKPQSGPVQPEKAVSLEPIFPPLQPSEPSLAPQTPAFRSTSHTWNDINIAILAEHFGVEEEDVVSLVEGFFTAGDKLMVELAKAREVWDLQQIHQNAHALKGGALNIQAHTLADAALLVEKAAKNRNMDGLDKLLDRLFHTYRQFHESWKDR